MFSNLRMAVVITIVLLGMVTCTACTADSDGPPTRKTLEAILKESLAGKLVYASKEPLAGGTVIPAFRNKIQAPAEFSQAQFYFIDDAPGANWEHPCRYVFVDTKTHKHVVIKSNSPPDDMSVMIELKEKQ